MIFLLLRVPTAISGALVLAAMLLLGGCSGATQQALDRFAPPPLTTEIRRTSYGLVHVRAQDEAGIGYGIGYAYAQDNVCMLAEYIVTVNGERSRYFGGDAIGGPDVDSGSIDAPNLHSDFYFKYLNAASRVEADWRAQKPQVQAQLKGYAAGYNRFVRDTGIAKLPVACRNAPWVREINERDLIRIVRRLSAEGGSLYMLKGLVAAHSPLMEMGGADRPQPRPQLASPKAIAWSERVSRLGSNGVALGKDATDNGRGLLLGNPHYPWLGSLRFYQVHATIPGKLDVMGVTLAGMPLIVIGFNRHLAWTHTVNSSAHSTLYALELEPGSPTQYRLDGKLETMTRITVVVGVKGSDGVVREQSHDFWISRYGPIVVLPRLEWSATRAYALRDANLDNDRLLATWSDFNHASSLDELQAAITSNLGLPWVNTIAVDAGGETLYTDITAVPNLTQAQLDLCIPEDQRHLMKERLFVLRAQGACEWRVDPAAPQAGIYAARDLPLLRRSDFVQNSNDSAWLTNPSSPLTGFASIVSEQDYAQNDRTRMGLSQIRARLTGSDGFSGRRFDAAALRRVAFSNRSYYGTLLREDLVRVCEDTRQVELEGERVDVQRACAAFRSWDMHANLDSIGHALAAAWLLGLEEREGIWRVPFSVQDPINTPRGIALNDPAVVRAVREELARAVLKLRQQGVDPMKPWGEIQTFERNRRRIPIHGGTDVYNAVVSFASQGRSEVRFGASYVFVVGFDEHGPQAQAFLTYSQSTDPASPYFADQTARFSTLDWIVQPYTDEQIEADPHYRSFSICE